MKKVLLWGMGNDYDGLLNQILFEIRKENISVVGIVCREKDRYCPFKDGFKVISKEELKEYPFDYIIITSFAFHNAIKTEAISCGVEETKIINGEVLRRPFFDFKRYVSLIESPITILSDDCWSGYIYNYLGLPFSTPLINIYWNRDEYIKFIQDPVFYLNTELKVVSQGDLRKGESPVGMLGNDEKNVKLELVHNVDFNEALEQWNRRKDRINFNNLFVKMGFSSNITKQKKEEYFSAFDKVPYKKILFYYGDENINGMFKTERFIWKQLSGDRVDCFDYNDYCRSNFVADLDILKLLETGEGSRYDCR